MDNLILERIKTHKLRENPKEKEKIKQFQTDEII